MINQEDRIFLRDAGREYLLDIALDSKVLKNKLTFKEHVELCNAVTNLTYEEVIELTITEGIKEFESKFGKFLKYSFAAIAGMAAGLGTAGGAFIGPPIAMFVLYVFRKLTDTCSRSCLAKIPFSSKRKICRYECQVNACKNIVRDLRSEMSKCSSFANAEKCEKSLRKEYIKWSRRLQSQMIKLHQAKLGEEEKARKKRAKELAKKAKAISSSFQVSKSDLLNIVTESKTFRENTSFRNHLQIYKAVKTLEEDDDIAVTPPKIDPTKEKWARRALYLGLWVIPIPFFNDVVNYIIKKHNFACIGKCSAQKKFSKSLCINQCSYLSAKYAVGLLNKQLKSCEKADKAVKCKKKIYAMLEDWKQREVEAKIKFESNLRSELRKVKEREGKQ
jgi:hypothetical protein